MRWLFAAGTVFFCAAALAHAQTIPTYNPAAEAAPDSWSKPPINFGPFLLFSDVTISESYDNNIYAQPANTESDFITTVKPMVQLTKSFGRHDFALSGSTAIQRYLNNANDNTMDVDVSLLGNLEAYHSLHIPLLLAYSKDHLERSDVLSTSATREPIRFNTKTGQTGLVYEPNRLRVELLGEYEEYRVETAERLLTGEVVSGKDKDKNNTTLSTTVSYEMGPNFRPMIRLQYGEEKYLRRGLTATGFDGANRNNQVTKTLAGVTFDYKGLIGGTALFGRENREYEEPGADAVSGLSSQTRITFAPTRRLNGEFLFHKLTRDDNIILSAVNETTYNLLLTQEISSRWLGRLGLEYKQIEFPSSDREDDRYTAFGSVVYRVQRGLDLEGSYRYQTKESTDPAAAFDQSVFMLSLKHQF